MEGTESCAERRRNGIRAVDACDPLVEAHEVRPGTGSRPQGRRRWTASEFRAGSAGGKVAVRWARSASQRRCGREREHRTRSWSGSRGCGVQCSCSRPGCGHGRDAVRITDRAGMKSGTVIGQERHQGVACPDANPASHPHEKKRRTGHRRGAGCFNADRHLAVAGRRVLSGDRHVQSGGLDLSHAVSRPQWARKVQLRIRATDSALRTLLRQHPAGRPGRSGPQPCGRRTDCTILKAAECSPQPRLGMRTHA